MASKDSKEQEKQESQKEATSILDLLANQELEFIQEYPITPSL
jgi:hypothetical protein